MPGEMEPPVALVEVQDSVDFCSRLIVDGFALRLHVGVCCVNVAVTLTAEFIVTMQLVPLQAPLQPAKVQPAAGVALSVTCVPLLKFALQVAPQLIPDGVLVTVPLPKALTVSV
jgi:hypothetical protein